MEINYPEQEFIKEGKFDKKKAMLVAGRAGGICYSNSDFDKLDNETEEATLKRSNNAFGSGHLSLFDHVFIRMEIVGLPKLLAMVLNNEHQYTTSERSFRYTTIKEGQEVSDLEIELYNKWVSKLLVEIDDYVKEVNWDMAPSKMKKLAMENARYMVNPLVPTSMSYSTTWRQINNIASWAKTEIDMPSNEVMGMLKPYLIELVNQLEDAGILEEGLMRNDKCRSFSLVTPELPDEDYFSVTNPYGTAYDTSYKASIAYLAQAHRHRTKDFTMRYRDDDPEWFIPAIIRTNQSLMEEWINDLVAVRALGVHPQAELLRINENGNYQNFLLACKERLCTFAQYEIFEVETNQFLVYRELLKEMDSPYAKEFAYTFPIRCAFPDYKCPSSCGLPMEIRLNRKI